MTGLGLFLVALTMQRRALSNAPAVPSRSDRLSAGLLQCHLLRRAGHPGLADPQHPGRVLVGHHHHDDGRLRRQGASLKLLTPSVEFFS